jgi:hypothetical protein
MNALILCSLIALSWLYLTQSTFKSQIPDPFPQPKYPSGNRTAVILSGQFRVANFTILSPHVKGYQGSSLWKFFGGDDPPTPITTHLEHFLGRLGQYGGVDLFVYIQTNLAADGNHSWDGNPESYEVSYLARQLS